jgi:DNA-directed RNA polymerase subunit M/transcription elongation factor TFIIS
MMHSKPMSEADGVFREGWKPTKAENPGYRCRKCNSDDVWYRIWDSNCGGYEDVQYECRSCQRTWWVESADS